MNLIDTHCHLYLDDFANDINEIISRANENGVTRFYLPAIDSNTHNAVAALEEMYPGICFAMMGLHPCSVRENYLDELELVERALAERPFAAVGECGLDFYWDTTFSAEQFQAFRRQASLAIAYNMPLVIHSRNAMRETINVIREMQNGGLKGIFHCFSGTEDEAKEIVDLGFLLGIGGVITYKKSTLPSALMNINLEMLVLETDAPYLTPVPFRGKRNESSYLPYIASKLAEVKMTDLETVAKQTTENALKLFGR